MHHATQRRLKWGELDGIRSAMSASGQMLIQFDPLRNAQLLAARVQKTADLIVR